MAATVKYPVAAMAAPAKALHGKSRRGEESPSGFCALSGFWGVGASLPSPRTPSPLAGEGQARRGRGEGSAFDFSMLRQDQELPLPPPD